MKQNKFGELIFSETDLCDFVMRGVAVDQLVDVVVDHTVDLDKWPDFEQLPRFVAPTADDNEVDKFHKTLQKNWHMPEEYKCLDIAAYVLSLCQTEAELQRCGAELMLYQERDLFDLLRYLKYLVDLMTANKIIWGVGRGSSVASYVLYLLGVHRINSMYYNLDIEEFLR